MPRDKLPWLKVVWAVFCKDVLCEYRTRYAVSSLMMFALVTLSSVSMSLGGRAIPPDFAAVLLWLVLFFCAMAGLSRSFVQEQEAGTLFVLRLYASAQAVLFGKLTFNVLLLFTLTLLMIPLFIIFLNIEVPFLGLLVVILMLGTVGIATAGTMTAAMVSRAQGQGALFTVLTFPVLLPQFLSSISVTNKVLSAVVPELSELCFMAGYDIVLLVVASLLFDYLWYD